MKKERHAEFMTELQLCCYNQDWMKNGGLILWNANATCEMSKTSWQKGKQPHERIFGEPFKAPIIPFGAMVEYHPISVRDQSRIHQIGKTVLPGIFLGYALIAGRNWKGHIMIADSEELEKMDASEISPRRTNAKETVVVTQKRRIHIPSGRWCNKIVRKRLRIPRTHSEAGTNRKE